jgi:hypothetical protein
MVPTVASTSIDENVAACARSRRDLYDFLVQLEELRQPPQMPALMVPVLAVEPVGNTKRNSIAPQEDGQPSKIQKKETGSPPKGLPFPVRK